MEVVIICINKFYFFNLKIFVVMKYKLLLVLAFVLNVVAFGQSKDTAGGWVKYEKNPILGGSLGTIFDVSVLKDDDGSYRMYNSWRDQKSIALSVSKDRKLATGER